MSAHPLAVMVNGIPGPMASATASEVLSRPGLVLADEALTGAGMSATARISDATVALSGPDDHAACLARTRANYPRLVVVDYTHPAACNANVALYAAAGVSFVLGTTGGDVARMVADVEAGAGYAVIAPNMGKQIVAFQAMMAMMARQFPGVFNGYAMTVTESHQSTKADTSGTAKAVVQSFNDMGVEFEVDDIEKVRRAPESMDRMGVPGKYVTAGHAFHTYALTSPDGTVNFQFQHNVCGRAVYAAGTVDAVVFLDAKKAESGSKRVFNMIDILRSGKMKD